MKRSHRAAATDDAGIRVGTVVSLSYSQAARRYATPVCTDR